MAPVAHPGRFLKRELAARALSANRLALDLGVPSGRVTDILNGRRAISADTALRLGRYFGNTAFSGQVGTGWPKKTRHINLAQFWLDLQSEYDIALVEREKGKEIAKRLKPADANVEMRATEERIDEREYKRS
jgi:addiction module HigA family antidote